MKKHSILRLLSAATIAAAGLFAIGASTVKTTENVLATDYVTIYCTKSIGNPTSDIYVHQWGGSTPQTDWDSLPSMTEVFENQFNQSVYKIDIPSDRTGIIFRVWNNDSLVQSVNVEPSGGFSTNDGWYFSGWDNGKLTVGSSPVHPFTIIYHGNGSDGGSMDNTNAYADVSWGLDANAFTKTGCTFDKWTTNADGSGDAYSNGGKVAKDYDGATLELYAQWRKSYTSAPYIFLNNDFDMENAIIMTKSGNDHVATITLKYQDSFKVAWYTDSSGALDNYYGYSRMYSGCGAYHYFSAGTSDALLSWARGTYRVYINDQNLSVELDSSLNAEHLAAQLMGFEEKEGHCGDSDRFPAMKEIYLDLDPAEQEIFQKYASSSEDQFKNAYKRYTDWATALRQKPWEEGSLGSAHALLASNQENSTNIAILAIIAVVSVGAIGGYLFIKKRKEN